MTPNPNRAEETMEIKRADIEDLEIYDTIDGITYCKSCGCGEGLLHAQGCAALIVMDMRKQIAHLTSDLREAVEITIWKDGTWDVGACRYTPNDPDWKATIHNSPEYVVQLFQALEWACLQINQFRYAIGDDPAFYDSLKEREALLHPAFLSKSAQQSAQSGKEGTV